ncbi:membrane-bound serine protease (ClpP class) [Persephonella hydrogeniphila]|uniref:Membrane-bound serine protease (ClpP class) n=1 Tax=Persephonella hydrogeniphila TaxID=198703 RepID=A0A285NCF7_9AQUI|nr:nodulation protein NfeD [Persephonella hydrogeniphila]SNZ07182.1 membrane-bound serine protease (ClpP class) [Persephonella hydrogeniphila]
MKKLLIVLVFLISFQSKADIILSKWEGAVSPVMADYIKRVVTQAEEKNAKLIVIQLDTPGGLESAMRDVIKTIMNTYIPVVVYVYPPGARAASAGAIITISADIAAMAPSTNIGSASPVQMTGREINETMKKKIINDMVAFVKSIAKAKGRNEKVIEKMVTQSINLTAEEALKKGVIDIIATDMDDLIKKVNGRKIKKKNAQITVKIEKNEKIIEVEKGFREKLLSILANPTLAYLLLMIGFYGIFFELYNPGSVIPGVIGAVSILLALYALNTIDVNWLGVLLILLGILFFVLELITPTFGALAVSGVIALLIGSIILVDPSSPYGDIPLKVIIPVVIFSTVFFLSIAYLGVKAQMKKSLTGKEGMIGKTGIAETDINPKGKVFVEGEIWDAYSETPIKKGEEVKILSVEGLRLKVTRAHRKK